MSFFDKFLKAVGFEENDENESENLQSVNKKKEKSQKIPSAKFNLKNKVSSKTFEVETLQDVQKAAKLFSKGENVLVDFSSYCENKNEGRVFLLGVCFAFGGELKKLDENLFLMEV